MSRGEPANVLGPIDDFELAIGPDQAGVAGLDIAILGQSLCRTLGIAEIADEHARRAELHFAVLGDAQIDMGRGRADRVGAHRAVGLRRDVEKGLRLTVELLQVHAERPIEGEDVGADRFARRVGDADAREAEGVL